MRLLGRLKKREAASKSSRALWRPALSGRRITSTIPVRCRRKRGSCQIHIGEDYGGGQAWTLRDRPAQLRTRSCAGPLKDQDYMPVE